MNNVSPRILYVDAAEDPGKIIDKLILNADPPYDISLVSSRKVAIGRAVSEIFDLYILDFPAVRDVTLCRQIRMFDSTTPILFLSSDARLNDREKTIAAGANDFLMKCGDYDLIAQTVRCLLNETGPPSRDRTLH